jgi:histidine ammonia-lyase
LAAEAGASEQDDINANGYIACRNQRQVAYLFDRIMAVLGGVASHALDIQDRRAPLELANFVAEIRKYFPPVTKKRIIGNSAARLAHRMSDAIDNGNSVMTETIANRV